MKLRSGRSVHVPVPAYRPRARHTRPTGGGQTEGANGSQTAATTGENQAAGGGRGASNEPASNFTYSAVDAWNPTPRESQPRQPSRELFAVAVAANQTPRREQSTRLSPAAIPRQEIPEKREREPSIEFVAEAPAKKKQKIASHRKIKVPLNDAQAARRAEEIRDFIPHAPLNITHGDEYVRGGKQDQLVWAGPGVETFEAMLVVSPTSPWIISNADWPCEDVYDMFRLPRPSRPPTPTRYEVEVLGRETQIPWMKPAVTLEFQQARYEAEEQPRTKNARERDGMPVSPLRLPTVEEMSRVEFKAFAATVDSTTPPGSPPKSTLFGLPNERV